MTIEAPISGQISIEGSIIAARKAKEGLLTSEEETEAGKQILADFKSGLAKMQDYRDAIADLYLEENREFSAVTIVRLGIPYEVWYRKEKDEWGVTGETLSVYASIQEGFSVNLRYVGDSWATAEVEFRDPNYEILPSGSYGPEHTQLAVTKSNELLQKLSTPDPK